MMSPFQPIAGAGAARLDPMRVGWLAWTALLFGRALGVGADVPERSVGLALAVAAVLYLLFPRVRAWVRSASQRGWPSATCAVLLAASAWAGGAAAALFWSCQAALWMPVALRVRPDAGANTPESCLSAACVLLACVCPRAGALVTAFVLAAPATPATGRDLAHAFGALPLRPDSAGVFFASLGLSLSVAVRDSAFNAVPWYGPPAAVYVALFVLVEAAGAAGFAALFWRGRCGADVLPWAFALPAASVFVGCAALVGWEPATGPVASAGEPFLEDSYAQGLSDALILFGLLFLAMLSSGLARKGSEAPLAVLMASLGLCSLVLDANVPLGFGYTEQSLSWAVLFAGASVLSGYAGASGSAVDKRDKDGDVFSPADELFLRVGLTQREVEVARRIARGRTLASIAGELGLARSTVGTYAARAYERIGVAGRQELLELVAGLEVEKLGDAGGADGAGGPGGPGGADDADPVRSSPWGLLCAASVGCTASLLAIVSSPWPFSGQFLIAGFDSLRVLALAFVAGCLVLAGLAHLKRRSVAAWGCAACAVLFAEAGVLFSSPWARSGLVLHAVCAYALPLLLLFAASRLSMRATRRQAVVGAACSAACCVVFGVAPTALKPWVLRAALLPDVVLFTFELVNPGMDALQARHKVSALPRPAHILLMVLFGFGLQGLAVCAADACAASGGGVVLHVSLALLIAFGACSCVCIAPSMGAGADEPLTVVLACACAGAVVALAAGPLVPALWRPCLFAPCAALGCPGFVLCVRTWRRRARLASLDDRGLWSRVAADVGLSEGEVEVLVYLGRGYSVNAVAEKLVISGAAVASRREKAYAKLGIHSRANITDVLIGLVERHEARL